MNELPTHGPWLTEAQIWQAINDRAAANEAAHVEAGEIEGLGGGWVKRDAPEVEDPNDLPAPNDLEAVTDPWTGEDTTPLVDDEESDDYKIWRDGDIVTETGEVFPRGADLEATREADAFAAEWPNGYGRCRGFECERPIYHDGACGERTPDDDEAPAPVESSDPRTFAERVRDAWNAGAPATNTASSEYNDSGLDPADVSDDWQELRRAAHETVEDWQAGGRLLWRPLAEIAHERATLDPVKGDPRDTNIATAI